MITLCVVPNLKVESTQDLISCIVMCLALDAMYLVPMIFDFMS